jgi:hypothetical protein
MATIKSGFYRPVEYGSTGVISNNGVKVAFSYTDPAKKGTGVFSFRDCRLHNRNLYQSVRQYSALFQILDCPADYFAPRFP